MQLIGYVVAVVWLLFGWCNLIGCIVEAIWPNLALIWFIADWVCRWSYLVLIWFIAGWMFDVHIVGVNDIWLGLLAIWLLQFTVGLCKLCNNTDHLRLHPLLCGNRL